MSGLALWAFGTIWAIAGFILGASAAARGWRQDRDTWRTTALATHLASIESEERATHYEKLHRAKTPEIHKHEGITYEHHDEDGTIEIQHSHPCQCPSPEAPVPVWQTTP